MSMQVLIADDHPIICIALSDMLRLAFPERSVSVAWASDSDTLLCMLEACKFDILVLDLQMPGRLRSVPLLETIVAAKPDLKIVVYTGLSYPLLALATLEQGAKAHVLKISGPRVAMDAVRTVSLGGTFVDPAIDIKSTLKHPWFQLTGGERSVLLALARGEDLRVIALESGRSYKTVTTHKYNALAKLGLRSNAEIVPYLASHGLDYLLW